MPGFTLHTLTNYQPRLAIASSRRSPATGGLGGLFGLAVVGVMSIAFAAVPFATATRIGGTAESPSVVRIDAAGAYHHARVLEPGSRGSVVEV